jgi:HNH endonuclease
MCPITGIADISHPIRSPNLPKAVLQCSHILKRAVAVFPSSSAISDADKNKASSPSFLSFFVTYLSCDSYNKYRFAMSTLDILAHYTSINQETVVEIVQNIDSPSNGIAMQSDWHTFFDIFEVCLVSIPDVCPFPFFMNFLTYTWKKRDNAYVPKVYSDTWPAGIKPRSNEIVFQNHSSKNIELPNADFIKLHAALCGVLHMSGAGDDIDNLLQHLKKDRDGNGPPADIFQSGGQFRDHMELHDSISEMFSGLVLAH